MGAVVDLVVVVVFVVATATWVGGLVTAVVVVGAARASLAPPERVRFFRALGRRYLTVVGGAFVLTVSTGWWLLRGRPWDAAMTALGLCVAALVLCTGAGVVQARTMTGRRRRSLDSPDDPALAAQVRVGARRAAVLRTAIVVLTLAGLVLGAAVATG